MPKIKKYLSIVASSWLCLTLSYAQTAPVDYTSTFITAKPVTGNGKLSFYFQDIEIRSLLQLIAKSSGVNFVISDAVKGNVTINLTKVTWQQALNVILKSRGLASRRTGNVVYISTLDEITANETKQLQSQQSIANLEPLRSTIIHLRYANATDIANLLKSSEGSLLTSRGEVAIDARTNSVILRDVGTNITLLERQIHVLDIPARQVLIEARIVNLDSTYEEQLGVRFGISDSRHLSGTFAAASAITNGTSPSAIENPTQRLIFNVPARQLFDGTTPGSIAVALANIGPVLLDLELSALEGENHAKIIARPRVITSNQKKAIIQTGQEIPYQEATSSGATSVTFKDAVLSLEITPQITPNNKIILTVKANEDTQGQSITTGSNSITGATTVPIINTQSVESSLLLNDQETIVLGGIYRQTRSNTITRIPFLGSLPVLGYLFKNTSVHDEKHELLIFITPKIIRPLAEAAAAPTGVFKDEA